MPSTRSPVRSPAAAPRAWASSVGDFADGLDAAAADAEAADARAQAFQGWLRTFLGGGS
jgi:hypothetical protein